MLTQHSGIGFGFNALVDNVGDPQIQPPQPAIMCIPDGCGFRNVFWKIGLHAMTPQVPQGESSLQAEKRLGVLCEWLKFKKKQCGKFDILYRPHACV
jgi:hypothetical protein